MGGYGSGRRSAQPKKDIADHVVSIDVRAWKRQGHLCPNLTQQWQWSIYQNTLLKLKVRVESFSVRLSFRISSDQKSSEWEHQTVMLDSTACHFGGDRSWFLCPSRGCGKRVAILYFTNNFACRECQNLAYLSQRQPPDILASRRVDRTREKLGWKPGFLNGMEWKPKGMHWATFKRLLEEHEKEAEVAKIRLLSSLGINWLTDSPFG